MTLGYTGKLPAYGDFVQGGGVLHACNNWSAWAENGLTQIRDTPGFHDTFLISPIWRFAVAGDIFDTAPTAGVFCPSMDKVGRLFPFTVVAALPSGISPIAACTALGPWFDQLEASVLAALDPSATVEALAAVLENPPALASNANPRNVAASPRFEPLTVTPEGDPISASDDLLDLSGGDSQDCDGVWITLGGIDADAHGVTQFGGATNALFKHLVMGGGADDG